ncbi:ammonia-forming cytochrome c nitrite reductase subunit c552 [Shewanella sp. FJAT-51649]|uniref:ammonia-forming cytochrome c nitrite reductase subunit c552 n=1 Tax=Shewanella sp. FJAT-51649 TaxID=2864210 RepID=UPI001C66131F|nr:ammonia-forming cytochrome c nitrite reductase subunit c552 [Shewanella sp. FJAT-51649]QYJ71325.1 ammonia-forming cytochrome c nitrite reductase subunit c552 [Shewanella sp. FJAT-51649]
MKQKVVKVFSIPLFVVSIVCYAGNDIDSVKKTNVAVTDIAHPENSSNWREKYPNQYESWLKTKEISEWEDTINTHPAQAIIRAGTSDITGPVYQGLRGHFYSIIDFSFAPDGGTPRAHGSDDTTSRCLLCHTSNSPELIKRDGEMEFLSSSWTKYGSEALNPIGCANCHDPKTAELRVVPTWLDEMLKKAGLPDFSSSSKKDKKILVCAQCHFEAYTEQVDWVDKNGEKRVATVTRTPWKNGLSLDDMEKFYDNGDNFPSGKPYFDFINPISKTPIIMPEHPDFELLKSDIHGKVGLSCPDCHMPKTSNDSATFSNHRIGSPLETIEQSCIRCHKKNESDMKSMVSGKKKYRDEMAADALDNLAKAHLEAGEAWRAGATDIDMAPVLADIRSSYWKLNSVPRAAYVHAPRETVKAIQDAVFKAKRARDTLKNIFNKYGVKNFKIPEFDTKEKAFAILNLQDRPEYMKGKCDFIKNLRKEWIEKASSTESYDKNIIYPIDMKSAFDKECKNL